MDTKANKERRFLHKTVVKGYLNSMKHQVKWLVVKQIGFPASVTKNPPANAGGVG